MSRLIIVEIYNFQVVDDSEQKTFSPLKSLKTHKAFSEKKTKISRKIKKIIINLS